MQVKADAGYMLLTARNAAAARRSKAPRGPEIPRLSRLPRRWGSQP
jgi:hypothetical protein